MYYVFDLDGTLADTTHREHLREDGDWDSYFKACKWDIPHYPVVEMIRSLLSAGNVVELWTGRSDIVKEDTLAWLTMVGLLDLTVRMRSAGDTRDDYDLKLEWWSQETIKPDMFVDDREQIIDALKEHGIPCMRVYH
jgi:phosphoglycolate phosphatase-like HAD superfamily hydrolase